MVLGSARASLAHDVVWFKIRNTAGHLNQKYGWPHLTVCMVNPQWWNYYWKPLLKLHSITMVEWYPGWFLNWVSLDLEQIFRNGQNSPQITIQIFSSSEIWLLVFFRHAHRPCCSFELCALAPPRGPNWPERMGACRISDWFSFYIIISLLGCP